MVGNKVVNAQENQKRHYSNNPSHINLPTETPVLIRNYAAGPKLTPATVKKQHGPVANKCTLEDSHSVKHHQDQIIIGHPSGSPLRIPNIDPLQVPVTPLITPTSLEVARVPSPKSSSPEVEVEQLPTATPVLRRSSRLVLKLTRLDL